MVQPKQEFYFKYSWPQKKSIPKKDHQDKYYISKQSFLKELNIFVQKLVGQHQCYAVKPVLNGRPGTQRIINDVMMFEDDSLVLHCASLLCIIVVTCSVHM